MSTVKERLRLFERPRSRAAVWCQRIAVFVVPYLLIVVLGHRFGLIETPPVFWMLGFAVLLLALAIALGIRAFYGLWVRGEEGGLRAMRGLTLALLLLAPFLFFAQRAVALPPIHDISTDLEQPPEFVTAIDDRGEDMNRLEYGGTRAATLQLAAYPQVNARRYPLDSGRVFSQIADLVAERGWTILADEDPQGPAAIDAEGSGLVALPATGPTGELLRPAVPRFRAAPRPAEPPTSETLAGEPQAVAPTGREESEQASDERYVEAVATSFVMGFESDIVIRLVEEDDGTLVDMRAASRWGAHDLGANARLIMAFMTDLDTILQGQGTDG